MPGSSGNDLQDLPLDEIALMSKTCSWKDFENQWLDTTDGHPKDQQVIGEEEDEVGDEDEGVCDMW